MVDAVDMVHTGAMIALVVPNSKNFAINPPTENSLPPEDLHITLAYLGEASEISQEERSAILEVCQVLSETSQAPEMLFPASTGVFPPDPESPDPDPKAAYYAAPASPERLYPLREDLITHLNARGVGHLVSTKHPVFTPHVTLTYETLDNPPTLALPTPVPTEFTKLICKFGDELHEFELNHKEDGSPLPITASVRSQLTSLASSTHHSYEYTAALYLRQTHVQATPAQTRAQQALTLTASVLANSTTQPPVYSRVSRLLGRIEVTPNQATKALLAARALALTAKTQPNSATQARELSALTASLQSIIADGNSSIARSLRARKQLRDRYGRWIETGGGVRFKVSKKGTPGGGHWEHGIAEAVDVPNGLVHVRLEDGRLVAIPNRKIEQPKAIIGLKGQPTIPKARLKSLGRKGKATPESETSTQATESFIELKDNEAFLAIDALRVTAQEQINNDSNVIPNHVIKLVNDNRAVIIDADKNSDTISLTGKTAPFKDTQIEAKFSDVLKVHEALTARFNAAMPSAEQLDSMSEEERVKAASKAAGSAIVGLTGAANDKNDAEASALRRMPGIAEADVVDISDQPAPKATEKLDREELLNGALETINELSKLVPDSSPLSNKRDEFKARLEDLADFFFMGDLSGDEYRNGLSKLSQDADAVEPDNSTNPVEQAFGQFAEDVENLRVAAESAGTPTSTEIAEPDLTDTESYQEDAIFTAVTSEMVQAINRFSDLAGALADVMENEDGTPVSEFKNSPEDQRVLDDFLDLLDKFSDPEFDTSSANIKNFSEKLKTQSVDFEDVLAANQFDADKIQALMNSVGQFEAALDAISATDDTTTERATTPNTVTQKDFFDLSEEISELAESSSEDTSERLNEELHDAANFVANIGKKVQDGSFTQEKGGKLLKNMLDMLSEDLFSPEGQYFSELEGTFLADNITASLDTAKVLAEKLIKEEFSNAPRVPDSTDIESPPQTGDQVAESIAQILEGVPDGAVIDIADDALLSAAFEEAQTALQKTSSEWLGASKIDAQDLVKDTSSFLDAYLSHLEANKSNDPDVKAVVAGESDRVEQAKEDLETAATVAGLDSVDAPTAISQSELQAYSDALGDNLHPLASVLKGWLDSKIASNEEVFDTDMEPIKTIVGNMISSDSSDSTEKAELTNLLDQIDSDGAVPSVDEFNVDLALSNVQQNEDMRELREYQAFLADYLTQGNITQEQFDTVSSAINAQVDKLTEFTDTSNEDVVSEEVPILSEDDLAEILTDWAGSLEEFNNEFTKDSFSQTPQSPVAHHPLSKSQVQTLQDIANSLPGATLAAALNGALTEHQEKKSTDAQLLSEVSFISSFSDVPEAAVEKLKKWQAGVQMNTKNSAPTIDPTDEAYFNGPVTKDNLYVMAPSQVAALFANLELQRENKAQKALIAKAKSDNKLAGSLAALENANRFEVQAENALYAGDIDQLRSGLSFSLGAYDTAIAEYKKHYPSKDDISTNLHSRRRAVDEMLAGLEGRKADAINTGVTVSFDDVTVFDPSKPVQNKYGEDIYPGDVVENTYKGTGGLGYFLGFRAAKASNGGTLIRGIFKKPTKTALDPNMSAKWQRVFAVGKNNPLYYDDEARNALGLKKVDELTGSESLYSFDNYDYSEVLEKYINDPKTKKVDLTGVEKVTHKDGTPISTPEILTSSEDSPVAESSVETSTPTRTFKVGDNLLDQPNFADVIKNLPVGSVIADSEENNYVKNLDGWYSESFDMKISNYIVEDTESWQGGLVEIVSLPDVPNKFEPLGAGQRLVNKLNLLPVGTEIFLDGSGINQGEFVKEPDGKWFNKNTDETFFAEVFGNDSNMDQAHIIKTAEESSEDVDAATTPVTPATPATPVGAKEQENVTADTPVKPLKDISNWTKVGGNQGGSNQAQLMEDENGQRWYVKVAKNNHNAAVAELASQLFEKFGLGSSHVEVGVNSSGNRVILSKWMEDFTPYGDLDEGSKKSLQEQLFNNFAFNAWVSNYDVIGKDFSNFGTDANGNLIHLDVDGTFDVEARGGKKLWWGPDAVDMDYLKSAELSGHVGSKAFINTTKFFKDITPEQTKESAKKLQNISEQDITDLVNESLLSDEKKTEFIDTLIKRRADILKRVGLEAEYTPPGNKPVLAEGAKVQYTQSNGVVKSGTVIKIRSDGKVEVRSDTETKPNGSPKVYVLDAKKWSVVGGTSETNKSNPAEGEPLTKESDFVYLSEPDPESPWFGEDKKPALPNLPKNTSPYLSQEWLDKVEAGYKEFLKNKGSKVKDLLKSSEWNYYYSAATHGSMVHLNWLHDHKRINDDLYNEAVALIKPRIEAEQKALANYTESLAEHKQKMLAWAIANGVPVLRLPGEQQNNNIPKLGSSETVSWWKKHMSGMKFTSTETNAVSVQKSSSSWVSSLRAKLSKKTPLTQEAMDATGINYDKEVWKGIKSAAEKTKIPEGELSIFAVRDVKFDAFHDELGIPFGSGVDFTKLIGSVQKDFGAAEGSAGNKKAGAYSHLSQGGISMNMHLLPGTEALYTTVVSGSHSGELGTLLAPASAYVITGAKPKPGHSVTDNQWDLDVVVIPQGLYHYFNDFAGSGYDLPIIYGDVPSFDALKPEIGNAVVTNINATDVDGITGN